MAIRVICPGCMTSFEVDDRFAGKKGPCPKCGHIIEIPKEKLVIHAPDDITDGGKTRKNVGHDARPILQERFTFTGGQIALGAAGAAAFFLISYLVGLAHVGWLSLIVGAILAFVIAYPIADFGYKLTRDENDLDKVMFEDPSERRRRSFFASLVFAGSWLVFEAFVYFLGGSGLIACLYLIPIAAIGSFGALIFFDCNFGKALLIYSIFAFAAIIGRGLIITDGWTPKGWIWETNYRSIATGQKNPSATKKAKPEEEPKSEDKAAESQGGAEKAKPAAAPKNEKKEPEKPALSREAPKVDPLKSGRRR